MKSWKTSLFALIAAVAGFIAIHPMYTAHWPVVSDIAGYIMAGGLAGMGLAAKDAAVHSTSVEVQESTIESNIAAQAAARKAGN